MISEMSDITQILHPYFKYMMSTQLYKEPDQVAGLLQAFHVVISHLWQCRTHWKITQQGHFSAVTSVLNYVIFLKQLI